MGFFSWKTCDTKESIPNIYSERKTFPVYVLIPKEFGGGYIEERQYEGYGVFGGKDIYALVANWNYPEKCKGIEESDRQVGIVMTCLSVDPNELKYPIKIASKPMAYEDAEPSEDDPLQGYFYPDDGEESEID